MTDAEITKLFSDRGLWDAATHWLSLSDVERKKLIKDLNKK